MPGNTKTSALNALAVASVDDTDYIPTLDSSATELKKLLLCDALAIQKVCQGRLTLESGVPVSTSDQTAKTNVYFTPYLGNAITLYNGTSWKLYTFTERTLALGTLTSGLPYDVFIYNNSGTLTLEATAWTNGTTRATAITLQDGVYVKSGSTTRRYLGTFYTTATTTTEDSLAKRFLWNYYNRVQRRLYVIDTTDHTYNGGSRQWRATSANKVELITGEATTADVIIAALVAGAANIYVVTYAGLDSATDSTGAPSVYYETAATGANEYSAIGGRKMAIPVGYHYLALGQTTGSSGSGTFYEGIIEAGIFN